MMIDDLLKKHNLPLVHKAALDYLKDEHASCFDDDTDEVLLDGFFWVSTNEGDQFWSLIMTKEFDKAKELCPHLFISDEDHEALEALLLSSRKVKALNYFKGISGWGRWGLKESLHYINFLRDRIKEDEEEPEEKQSTESLFKEIEYRVVCKNPEATVILYDPNKSMTDRDGDVRVTTYDPMPEIPQDHSWAVNAFSEPTDGKTGRVKLSKQ